MSRFISGFLSLLTFACLTGCTKVASPPQGQYAIWDNHEKQWISESELKAGLQSADFILIGGQHQSEQGQEQLLHILRPLSEKKWLQAVVMDYYPVSALPNGQTLSAIPANGPTHNLLRQWSEKENIPLYAGGVSKAEIKSMKDEAKRNELSVHVDGVLSEENNNKLRDTLSPYHGKKSNSNYMMAAQQLQDYRMAQVLLSLDRRVVLLSRTFHARNDMGVPPYLKVKKANTKTKSLLMHPSLKGHHWKKTPDSAMEAFDYVWMGLSHQALTHPAPLNTSKPEYNP